MDPSSTPQSSSDFPISDRNRAKRRAERAHYDKPTVYAILDAALLCHIAYVIDGQPFCMPITFWRKDDELYWHGSTMNRMLKRQQQQADVCLTVTHLDELVLTRSAYGHSVNYRSVMAFGRAALIEDEAEKRRAAEGLLDKFFPGRSGIAQPPSALELRQVSIMKMRIEQASAKIRKLPASEEPPEYLNLPVWAGVIPISMRIGEAQKCERLVPGVEPGADLREYVAGRAFEEVLVEGQKKFSGHA